MVHSIYSDRDIFLRELISNASDACEKLRYESILNPSVLSDQSKFHITLAADKIAGTLTISDNGIGMERDDLVASLGTIANSGTRAFLEKLGQKNIDEEVRENEGGKSGATADLIGQFGIGFYSAFMVADQVVVQSRRAGSSQAWSWTSDGKGTYTIAPLSVEQAPGRGTSVVLYLNSKSRAFLEPSRIESVVREHSGAVAVPIEFQDSPNSVARELADGAALWTKSKSVISEQDYKDFYQHLSGQFDDPAATVHWHVEGRHEYTVLAFIPGSRPLDLFDPERKGKGKLYVRRVLISQDITFLPRWLRFVKIIVDSSDIPLNVSREMVQESPVFAAIKRGLTSRILQEIGKIAENDAGRFNKIWQDFGAVIKEGIYEDPERRDALFKIAKFDSSLTTNEKRTLTDYVTSLRPNQTAIYYLTGEDAKRISISPQLEGFRARGVEVLLLSDPVDSFWVSTAIGFDGRLFKSVTQGAADIKLIPLLEGPADVTADESASAEVTTLLAYLKLTLADVVSDVCTSDRLSQSPACLVAAEAGPDRRLERILAQHGRLNASSKPILEINPKHALVIGMAQKYNSNVDKSYIDDVAWLLHDEARIMDGEAPLDAAAFATRLTRVMSRALE